MAGRGQIEEICRTHSAAIRAFLLNVRRCEDRTREAIQEVFAKLSPRDRNPSPAPATNARISSASPTTRPLLRKDSALNREKQVVKACVPEFLSEMLMDLADGGSVRYRRSDDSRFRL